MDVDLWLLRSPLRLLVVVGLAGLLLLNVYQRLFPKYPCPLPPSPRGAEPLLGHFRSLPLENAHLQHMEYAKQLSRGFISDACGPELIVVQNLRSFISTCWETTWWF